MYLICYLQCFLAKKFHYGVHTLVIVVAHVRLGLLGSGNIVLCPIDGNFFDVGEGLFTLLNAILQKKINELEKRESELANILVQLQSKEKRDISIYDIRNIIDDQQRVQVHPYINQQEANILIILY